MTAAPTPSALAWQAQDFAVHQRKEGGGAVSVAAVVVHGYVWKGLGLSLKGGWGEPRAKTLWRLTHLGSGLLLAELRGEVRTVFPAAGDLAEVTDWTAFDMPSGWQQTDPELPVKLEAWRQAAPAGLLAWPEPHQTWVKAKATVTDDEARAFFAARDQLGDGLAA